MPYTNSYIYDPEYDEFYVPDNRQCEKCANEALTEGLCKDHWEEKELEEMKEME